MFTDFKIAAAITNHFHQPIVDSVHADEFVHIIRQKIDTPNLLHMYVERKRLNHRRVDFQRMEASQIENFPSMTEEDIILLALGTYQLKLARSYCAEHLSNGL
ncbi:hypothetical protein PYW08_006129 [Mythimna loreyi]|uniref:Uncharacterized protein n=1 Tax=Mythimna loreyi TaxID=667449 RepID=A0ACC2QNP6_9NEOP|nr:hypothetical protein PYW08_006129 [Mythimna loreyi]